MEGITTAAEAKDARRGESRFAINMGRHATGADQQGRQERHQTPVKACVNIFKHVNIVGMSRLKSYNFGIVQDY